MKRLISILLAVVMVLVITPVNAVAEETITEATTGECPLDNTNAETNYEDTTPDSSAVAKPDMIGTETVEANIVTANEGDPLVLAEIAFAVDLVVEINEYIALENQTMFLVTTTGSVDAGNILSYDGTPMIYSNQYNAWCYLVITDSTFDIAAAREKITLNEGIKPEVSQTYNVNETENDTIDINDSQLVFDIYNNKYQDFFTVTMLKFLKADVNGDKTINVNDTIAIISQIAKAK